MQFPFKESVAYSSIHRHEDLSPCCIGTYNFKTIDYCNGLFTVLSAKDKKKLESIQNRAARLVFSTGRRSHAMPLLTELHWLPLPRIDFKICLIVFKIVNNCAPQYLINMLTLYKPVRNLRSSHDQTQLVVPRFNLSLSGQCFSIYAPKVWNELPSSIREAPSVAAFKNQLKTHFFCKL